MLKINPSFYYILSSTYLARPASSWIDDYIDWLAISDCCKVNATDGTFCPSSKIEDLYAL